MKSLKSWELTELTIAILEHQLAVTDGNVEVEHDSRLPVVDGSNAKPRQVDVAIRGTLGGRPFLRIVEVQKRARKVDQGFVDLVLGKCQAVGAHRATIVSERGFTDGAIQRSLASHDRLDLYRFRGPDAQDELPLKQGAKLKLQTDTSTVDLEFSRGVYEDALSESPALTVAYAPIETQEIQAVATMIFESTDDGLVRPVGSLVGTWPSRYGSIELTLNVTCEGKEFDVSREGEFVVNFRSRRLGVKTTAA